MKPRYPIIPTPAERLAQEIRGTIGLVNGPSLYCEYCKARHATDYELCDRLAAPERQEEGT